MYGHPGSTPGLSLIHIYVPGCHSQSLQLFYPLKEKGYNLPGNKSLRLPLSYPPFANDYLIYNSNIRRTSAQSGNSGTSQLKNVISSQQIQKSIKLTLATGQFNHHGVIRDIHDLCPENISNRKYCLTLCIICLLYTSRCV